MRLCFILLLNLLALVTGGACLILAGRRSGAGLIRQARTPVRTYRPQTRHSCYATRSDYRRSMLARRLAMVFYPDYTCSAGCFMTARRPTTSSSIL